MSFFHIDVFVESPEFSLDCCVPTLLLSSYDITYRYNGNTDVAQP